MTIKRKTKRTKLPVESVVKRIAVTEDLQINGVTIATVVVNYLPEEIDKALNANASDKPRV